MAEPWHLDRKFPVALIVAMMIQTGGLLFWGGHKFGTIESRLGQIESQKATDARLSVAENMIVTNRDMIVESSRRNEAAFMEIKEALLRLERKLETR